MSRPRPRADGPLLFARYAYPPNQLGYCGGDDPGALLEQTSAGVVDGGLRQALRAFEGAWPYLELIAAANGIDDPLDARVVEAYWLGSPLLERVGTTLLGGSLDERFRHRAGRSWPRKRSSSEPPSRVVPTRSSSGLPSQ